MLRFGFQNAGHRPGHLQAKPHVEKRDGKIDLQPVHWCAKIAAHSHDLDQVFLVTTSLQHRYGTGEHSRKSPGVLAAKQHVCPSQIADLNTLSLGPKNPES